MSKKHRPANSSVTRRRFLQATSATAVSMACSFEDATQSSPDTTVVPDSTVAADVSPDRTRSETSVDLAVVARAELNEAVALAVELAGGLDAIQPGQTVFIKPNAVHGFGGNAPGIVTTHDMLAAVIQVVKQANPGSIVVGDRSARFFESDSVFEMTGLGAAALKAGADEVYAAPKPSADPDAWVLVQPPAYEETWSQAGGVLVMKRLIEADHIINLPSCKNHRWAGFSLAMKNFIGGVGDESRDVMHYTEGDPDRLCRDIAILNQSFSPLLNILDARVALINGGPEGITDDANTTEPGLILASSDRVALDAMGAALIQRELNHADIHKPDAVHGLMTTTAAWSLPQVVHGIERSLGVVGPEHVAVQFDGVSVQQELSDLFWAGIQS